VRNDNAVEVSWEAPADGVTIAGFEVGRNDTAAVIATVGPRRTLYIDMTAMPGETYTYRVRSVGVNGGLSGWVSSGPITIPVAVPLPA
jgi:hypothetical protein